MENVFQFLTPKSQTFYIESNSTLRQALEKMEFHKFSIVPILKENGEYDNTLSTGDILKFIKDKGEFNLLESNTIHIKDLERYRPYRAFMVNESFDDLVKLSLDQNFVPVVDDRNMFIGIIKRKTIIQYLINKNYEK